MNRFTIGVLKIYVYPTDNSKCSKSVFFRPYMMIFQKFPYHKNYISYEIG